MCTPFGNIFHLWCKWSKLLGMELISWDVVPISHPTKVGSEKRTILVDMLLIAKSVIANEFLLT
jgi:hypothetical protein